jgi:hypothetical protein
VSAITDKARSQPTTATPRPPRCNVQPENCPEDLRDVRCWIVWRWTWAKEKWTKPPIDPATMEPGDAMGTPPKISCLTFDQAIELYESDPTIDGVGWLPYWTAKTALDADKCLEDEGEPKPWAEQLMGLCPGYTETSPSGKGLRVIVDGKLPGGAPGKIIVKGFGSGKDGTIEVFNRAGYVTFTGHMRAESAPIADRSAELGILFDIWSKAKNAGQSNGDPNAAFIVREEVTPEQLEAVRAIPDDELIERMRRGKKGDRFAQLFDEGTVANHGGDWSAADMSLVNTLCFWTAGDAARMDRLWAKSKLAKREKFDRDDYRRMTINAALLKATKFYKPRSQGGWFGNVVVAKDAAGGTTRHPLDQPDILKRLHEVTGGAIRRVGSALFAHEGGDAEVVPITSADQLFAYIGQVAHIHWADGAGLVTRRQLYEAARQTVQRYDSIEKYPHYPPVEGIYYACQWPRWRGSGAALEGLLDLFSPATEMDRELIRSYVLTLFWGGPPGERPMFLAEGPENDKGRGVGKSYLFSALAGLVGGSVSNISTRDDIGAITRRIINDAARKRCLILDNVKSERFSWADLEGMITGPTVGGYQLYVGDGSRPNLFTYAMTINGASLSEDLAQRVVVIRLDRPKSYDSADDKSSWSEAVRMYIREKQTAIFADILTAFEERPAPVRSAQRWASWTRDVLARCKEPAELQKLILTRQASVNDDAEQARALSNYVGERIGRKFNCEPANVSVWMSTEVLAEILTSFLPQPVRVGGVTKKLKAIRPPGMDYDRASGGARGWTWTGDYANRDAEAAYRWIHPDRESPGTWRR